VRIFLRVPISNCYRPNVTNAVRPRIVLLRLMLIRYGASGPEIKKYIYILEQEQVCIMHYVAFPRSMSGALTSSCSNSTFITKQRAVASLRSGSSQL